MLPALDDLLGACHGFSVPLRMPFRGVDHREGLLLEGPAGWGEFAPFLEYDAEESARWLAAAIEAAWQGWPSPVRDEIPVNAIVPAVSPTVAEGMVRESGCNTVKVKVAAADAHVGRRCGACRRGQKRGGSQRQDSYRRQWRLVDRRGHQGHRRSCAVTDLSTSNNPAPRWLSAQSCAAKSPYRSRSTKGIRKAADPHHVAGVKEAADILIVKVAPLGGVGAAQEVVDCYGLPAVVSSALDTSIGLAAGAALAASLPDLPYACGLGSGLLLST